MINTIDPGMSTDQILMLERRALDRWGKGDPGGFLELYAADITYFDPVTAARIDGHQAMVDYYRLLFEQFTFRLGTRENCYVQPA